MSEQPKLVIGGKEVLIWTEDQLSRINREALKNRAMNLRDAAGGASFPPMPRHPEGLVEWILQAQNTCMNGGRGGGSAYGGDDRNGSRGGRDDRDGDRAGPRSGGYGGGGNNHGQQGGRQFEDQGARNVRERQPDEYSVASEPASESQRAYLDAQKVARDARNRNQGSAIF